MIMELKKCPFCGKEVKYLPDENLISCMDTPGGCGFYYAVETELDDGVIAAWNTRPSPWKSVKDEPPKENDSYLLMVQRFGSCGREFIPEIVYYDTSLGWATRAECSRWMSIPKLPEKGK